MELIDPSTGKPAHRCDAATREWFRVHPGMDTTLAACEKCGLLYKTGREHMHRCEDLFDTSTGALLWPGAPDRCPGNGKHPDIEICCDNCDYWYECFPEPKILFNRARCRKCGTFLESKTIHDLQTCSCGAISIDGGQAYIRHFAKDLNDIEDLTEYAK